MKTKNRADRTGVVGASEKESHTSTPSFSKAGPPKLELQMGRKWVFLIFKMVLILILIKITWNAICILCLWLPLLAGGLSRIKLEERI